MSSTRTSEVKAFILSQWDETIRSCTEDDGTLIGLPHPYTIPSRKGAFQEFYYWDTYFSTLGLIHSDRIELAENNARNLLAQVQRYGYVPNGNRSYYLNRSQPPYLAAMVGLVDHHRGDHELRSAAYPLLEQEYEFWTTRRSSTVGLAHYGNHATSNELQEFFQTVKHRLGRADERAEDQVSTAYQAMAECESGWDFNSRFDHRCAEFCSIDLNTNLWLYEILLSQWAPTESDWAKWQLRAELRQNLIKDYCWSPELGIFVDYDLRNQALSTVESAASFQPLWAGLASRDQASSVVRNLLPRLEHAYGISPTAPSEFSGRFQWDHPNAWACLQHITYRGLERYGYHDAARRIAEKYVECVTQTFEKTGDLWEKYNVLDGSHHATEEAGYLINPDTLANNTADTGIPSEPPAMMGWTAGVFLDALAFLEEGEPYWLSPVSSTAFIA
ncbi:trehalase family glycosidase [Puniceicoccus vermicola]|uniref:Alpha,alpha-trehalase n=1 Tax=Puniceicoccus vermicola TaxID=388746 RepID=A0A7X1E613_9BACT|nr:trehalase family glycosidase [Puniceicoccus vermicola]MBC2603724.1 alpha,alpha-trehalase [Puniceicoccus vermicola]